MDKSQKTDEIFIKMISICKKYFPNNGYYFILFLLFKFTGLIIVANNFQKFQSDSTFSVGKIFRKLTYFGDLSGDSVSPINYNLLCMLIYFIIFFPIITFLLIYRKYSKRTTSGNQDKFLKMNKINWFYKILIKICAIIIIAIILLSQHIVEILAFPFALLVVKNTSDLTLGSLKEEIVLKLQIFENSLMMNYIVYLIINTLLIFIINFFLFYFMKIFNDPYISPKHIVKFCHNNYFAVIMIINFNIQGLHFYERIFTESFSFSLAMIIFSFIITSLLILFSIKKYIFPNFCNYLKFSLIFFCFYGSIISLIMYYSFDKEFTTALSLLKLSIQFILILLSVYYMIQFKKRWFQFKISENIFMKNKQIDSEYLFELVNILKDCLDDIRNFSVLFELIENHKNKCIKQGECACIEFDINAYYDNFQQRIQLQELHGKKKTLMFKKSFQDLVILVETEIVNYIFNLYKNKKANSQLNIVLLHCDFIFFFTRNTLFSLYLIQEYISKIKDIPFEYLFYFHDFKIKILRKRKSTLCTDPSNEKMNKKFEGFIHYYHEIRDIKELLAVNCEQFEKINMFQNVYSEIHANSSIFQHNAHNLERLFEDCGKLNKSSHKISAKLIENFTEQPLRNAEICYLLTNFYDITSKGIPNELKECFMQADTYEFVCRFDSCYLDQKFDHPLIMSMGSSSLRPAHSRTSNLHLDSSALMKSGFIIQYVSQKLCDYLGYLKNELLNNDFHLLLPDLFSNQHSLEMKRYLLIKEIFKLEKDTFVLSKDKYYVKTKVTCGSLPSLTNGILIISDMSLPNDTNESNWYLFILDSETNIISMSRNFEDKYKLTYEMLTRLKISFCTFFGLDFNKIKTGFQESIASVENSNIENIENLVNVFSYSNLTNTLQAYTHDCKNDTTHQEFKEQMFTISRQKDKLLPILERIKKSIEEQEYDTDWLSRIKDLEKMFSNNISPSNVFVGDAKYRPMIGENSRNVFNIQMKLRKLGKCPYYYVKLYDKAEVDIDNKIESQSKFVMRGLLSNNNLASCADLDQMKRFLDNKRKAETTSKQSTEKYAATTNNSMAVTTTLNESAQILMRKSEDKRGLFGYEAGDSTESEKLNGNGRYTYMGKYTDPYERTLFILLSLNAFVLTLLFSINFYYKENIYSFTHNLSTINFYGVMLKAAIYESASLFLSGCFRVDDLEFNPIDDVDYSVDLLKFHIGRRSADMFNYFNNYTTFLTTYYNNDGVSEIYAILFENDTYAYLNPDWTVYLKESTFENQMHYYHFNSAYMKRPDSLTECRVKQFFFNGMFSTSPNAREHKTNANQDEILVHYFMYNVITTFTEKIEKMILKTNTLLNNYMSGANFNIVVFNIVLLVFAIFMVSLVGFLITVYRNKIYALLEIFMIKNTNIKHFERRLSNFKLILNSFDEKVCTDFENLKACINKNNIEESSFKKELKSKNKKEKNSKRKEETDDKNETFGTETKGTKEFSIKILKISIVTILLAFLGYVLILVTNINEDYNNFAILIFTNQIALSFMDRFPKFNEMLMYYKVSILLDNPFYIKIEPKDYEDKNYHMKIYQENVMNMNDTRYLLLGNSKFAFLYYQFSETLMNTDLFTAKDTSSTLISRKAFNSVLNDKQCCTALAEYYSKFIGVELDLLTSNMITQSCKSLGNGINTNGLSNSFNSLGSYIMDIYVDFVKSRIPQIEKTLSDIHYQRAIRQAQMVYNLVWYVSNQLIFNDINTLFQSIDSNQMSYHLSGFAFNFIFILISFLLIINRIRKFYLNFAQTVERLSVALS